MLHMKNCLLIRTTGNLASLWVICLFVPQLFRSSRWTDSMASAAWAHCDAARRRRRASAPDRRATGMRKGICTGRIKYLTHTIHLLRNESANLPQTKSKSQSTHTRTNNSTHLYYTHKHKQIHTTLLYSYISINVYSHKINWIVHISCKYKVCYSTRMDIPPPHHQPPTPPTNYKYASTITGAQGRLSRASVNDCVLAQINECCFFVNRSSQNKSQRICFRLWS